MTTTASALDPKFAKIIRLMNSTQHEGERQACRARAEDVAASCGMTFEEAMAALDGQPSSSFDFKRSHDAAKERAWRERRYRAFQDRREATIAKYGSKEAVIAPCEREKLIVAAVGPWRKPCDHDPRWTDTLDGWRGCWFLRDGIPAHVLHAILEAYPMPSTFSEAKAEFEHWETRNQEIEDVLTVEGTPIGDAALDLPVAIRAEIVREMAEHKMEVVTLADLHARFAMYRQNENHSEEIEAALFRDLEEMVRVKVELSNPFTGSKGVHNPDPLQKDRHIVPTPSSSEKARTNEGYTAQHTPSHPSTSDHDVASMLRADPSRSDRDIARTTGCSPTTVGKIRRDLGAARRSR